jgi:signal transduction histidine kinase
MLPLIDSLQVNAASVPAPILIMMPAQSAEAETVIETTLARRGLRTRRTRGLTEALATLHRSLPQLLVLTGSAVDLLTLFDALRAEVELSTLVCIACLPAPSPMHESRLYRSGVREVVAGPLSPELLDLKVTVWLQQADQLLALTRVREFAHEVRHAISSIHAAAHMVTLEQRREPRSSDPGVPGAAKIILLESERLGRMVSSYLDAGSTPTISDQPITEDPLRLIYELLDISLSPPQRQRVSVCLDEPLADLAVDPDHLRQMLLNLIDNALTATAQGGEVQIKIRSDAAHAWIEICDTGLGIQPEHLDRIFGDGYTTGGLSAVSGQKRRGLGLGITRRLCQNARGDLTVHRNPGKGTTFRISLPRAYAAA